jgi:hypothetical protein
VLTVRLGSVRGGTLSAPVRDRGGNVLTFRLGSVRGGTLSAPVMTHTER